MSNREVERRLRLIIAGFEGGCSYVPFTMVAIFEADAKALRIAAEKFITKREKKCKKS